MVIRTVWVIRTDKGNPNSFLKVFIVRVCSLNSNIATTILSKNLLFQKTTKVLSPVISLNSELAFRKFTTRKICPRMAMKSVFFTYSSFNLSRHQLTVKFHRRGRQVTAFTKKDGSILVVALETFFVVYIIVLFLF